MRRWTGWARIGLVVVLVAVGLRLVVALPEQCPVASPAEARAAAERAVGWLERNQHPGGQWTYQYDRDQGRDLGGYNLVRHAGVLVSLYQAAGAGITDGLEVGDRGLAYTERNLVRHDDWAAFGTPDARVATGATALLVAALAERRSATGDDGHDGLMGELGRFLVGQVEDSGAVLAAWDPATAAPVPDEYSVFFTGETAWALAQLARAFPSEGWDAAAVSVVDYLPERDDAEDLFPPTSDHWAAYAYAELAAGPAEAELGTAQVADAHRLADIFGIEVRAESQRWRGGWARLVRGGPASGSGLGTLGEGTAALARFLPGEIDGLDVRIRCVAGMLVARQATGADPDPAEEGAWFTRGVTRMDDQQHALSALLAAEPVLTAGGATTGGGAEPHGLAWLLIAFVAAVNPARVPAPRSRRIAGLGVLGAAAVVAGVAAAATPLLDGLDVSPASARVAAGVVVGATAVVALVRARPAFDGLVVAAGLALALSAGADNGVARTVVAAAVAAAVAVAVPTQWRRPVLARPVAAVAVFVAADLIVDGVLGV